MRHGSARASCPLSEANVKFIDCNRPALKGWLGGDAGSVSRVWDGTQGQHSAARIRNSPVGETVPGGKLSGCPRTKVGVEQLCGELCDGLSSPPNSASPRTHVNCRNMIIPLVVIKNRAWIQASCRSTRCLSGVMRPTTQPSRACCQPRARYLSGSDQLFLCGSVAMDAVPANAATQQAVVILH